MFVSWSEVGVQLLRMAPETLPFLFPSLLSHLEIF